MSEEIFYRGGRGDEIILDPASLNLDALPFSLAMVGWAATIGYPQETGGDLQLSLRDMGGSGGKSAAEVALSLRLVDQESGELLEGYGVNDDSGAIEVTYRGVADLRFAEFVKTLNALSPFGI